MQSKKTQAKVKKVVNQNTIEALADVPKGVATSVVNDVVKGFGKGLWEQFLNIGASEQKGSEELSGDLDPGQELNLNKFSKKSREQTPKLDIEPGIDYRREIIHAEKRVMQENSRELSVKIQEILIELKQLMNVSQELKVEFKEIAVEPRIVNPGKYHVSFFEWVLLLVKQARMKVEDSAAWLAAFKSKKAKKQYWSMFKKHGTTFGLSNERVVATQTG